MPTEVRSPWNTSPNSPRWGTRRGARLSPSNRPDGQLTRSPGKGPAMRRDNSIPEPVVGGEHRTPFDYLDRR